MGVRITWVDARIWKEHREIAEVSSVACLSSRGQDEGIYSMLNFMMADRVMGLRQLADHHREANSRNGVGMKG